MNTKFGVGNVLAIGFRIWLRNLVPFLLITGLFYAVPWIWAASVVHGEPTLESLPLAASALGIATMLAIPLNVLVSAALTYGVVMELHGRRASIGTCITTGIVRFFPALGVGLLTWLCIAGASILLVVPGLIVSCMLYVAMQASVLERPGLVGALRRSRELTRGHKWQIFGLVLLLGLISVGTNLIARSVVSFKPQTVEEAFRNLSNLMYVGVFQQLVFGSLGAVMASVAYYLLRLEKEGTSAAELAAIFD
ncbi:MAG TPA: hypothetical protein VHT91_31120 [Kofleriaceae bacterium]|jgi:hypothetical protein|nr:hypothetical protein [Kofleriaceae bacterium]